MKGWTDNVPAARQREHLKLNLAAVLNHAALHREKGRHRVGSRKVMRLTCFGADGHGSGGAAEASSADSIQQEFRHAEPGSVWKSLRMRSTLLEAVTAVWQPCTQLTPVRLKKRRAYPHPLQSSTARRGVEAQAHQTDDRYLRSAGEW